MGIFSSSLGVIIRLTRGFTVRGLQLGVIRIFSSSLGVIIRQTLLKSDGSLGAIRTFVQQTKMPYRVSPPVLPLTEIDVEEENPLSGKFLKYMPSSFSSGCFIAAITREVQRRTFRIIHVFL